MSCALLFPFVLLLLTLTRGALWSAPEIVVTYVSFRRTERSACLLPALCVSCSPSHFASTYHMTYTPALQSFNTVLGCFQIFVVSPISCVCWISTSFQEESLPSLSDVVGISAGDASPSQTGHALLTWCWPGHVCGRSANVASPLFSSYVSFGNWILWSVLDDTYLTENLILCGGL